MDENEEIVTYSELLDRIDDEEAELDRERALYGNCDVDTCTYEQVSTPTINFVRNSMSLFRDTSNVKRCSFAWHAIRVEMDNWLECVPRAPIIVIAAMTSTNCTHDGMGAGRCLRDDRMSRLDCSDVIVAMDDWVINRANSLR